MTPTVTEEMWVVAASQQVGANDDPDIAYFRAMKAVNECWRTAISVLLGVSTAMLTLPAVVVAGAACPVPPIWLSLQTGGIWWFGAVCWSLLGISLASGFCYLRASAKGARRAAGLELSEPWDCMSFKTYEWWLDLHFRICLLTALGGAVAGIIFGLRLGS